MLHTGQYQPFPVTEAPASQLLLTDVSHFLAFDPGDGCVQHSENDEPEFELWLIWERE